MRKYFLAILLFAFIGCEKDFNEIIDVTPDNYQVNSISGVKNNIDLFENPGDSVLNLGIVFNPGSEVNKVYFDIYASDNSVVEPSHLEMLPAGMDTFKNQFILRSNNPIGNYSIKFSVSGNSGVEKQVAAANFFFNNGQDSAAPVISNLVMPDSILAEQTILFYVEVADSNGLNDIDFVYYEAYDPNGVRIVNSQGVFQFPMFDNGQTQVNGDLIADDGKFTVVLTFPGSVMRGTWRFEFQARDRVDLLSNKIIHNIVVQ